MADARAQAAFHHRPRDQEGEHDQENGRVRETGVGLRRIDDRAEDGGRDGEHRGGEDRQRIGHDGDDSRREDREQPPRWQRQPRRRRREPDAERQTDGRQRRGRSPPTHARWAGCMAAATSR
jgi:hypothetical protein